MPPPSQSSHQRALRASARRDARITIRCNAFGHLVHHRFSRHSYDRPDVYDGRGPYALAWVGYRMRLFGGVYLSELLSL